MVRLNGPAKKSLKTAGLSAGGRLPCLAYDTIFSQESRSAMAAGKPAIRDVTFNNGAPGEIPLSATVRPPRDLEGRSIRTAIYAADLTAVANRRPGVPSVQRHWRAANGKAS